VSSAAAASKGTAGRSKAKSNIEWGQLMQDFAGENLGYILNMDDWIFIIRGKHH
jgi:hypothetical protein